MLRIEKEAFPSHLDSFPRPVSLTERQLKSELGAGSGHCSSPLAGRSAHCGASAALESPVAPACCANAGQHEPGTGGGAPAAMEGGAGISTLAQLQAELQRQLSVVQARTQPPLETCWSCPPPFPHPPVAPPAALPPRLQRAQPCAPAAMQA